tara:strand:+ start:300 stop:488 length:189 start_codon:yes stop_codon:yes gene_type:complete
MNLSDSTILITGGTGSFGNRVAAHLLKQSLGTEYTSANTCQFDSVYDIKPLLDQMGETELYI